VNPDDDISKINCGDYERPGSRYRCGRGAAWRKPCSAGPTPDGKCGGVTECQPTLRHGKYECRRPAGAGGPCAEGPKADGTCSQCHPPCLPRLTLRSRRGRLTWQLCGLALLVLAAGFHFGIVKKSRPLAADAGPLSAKHAHFTAQQGCAACHAAHESGFGRLVGAAFTHSDMNAQCGACHTFGGPAANPHNETYESHDGPAQTDCRMCHTEHRGADARLTTITDAQCQTCHRFKFHSFARDHPVFSANFPPVPRAAVRFDHAKHLLDYFKQPANVARAPATCVACHPATLTERNVAVAGFDVACARCHADQIPQNELVLLRLPDPVAPADVARLGADDATAFMAWFLQRAGSTNYGVAWQRLVSALARDGAATFTRELDALAVKTNAGAAMLAGLSPELLFHPAQLWTNQQKFDPAAATVRSGWYWMQDMYPELHYKPAGHADAVARAWLELAVGGVIVGDSTDAADHKRAAAFENEVVKANAGVGRCLKCHAVTSAANGPRRIDWNYAAMPVLPHTKYSHGAHLGLLRCEECHVLNPQANYAKQFGGFVTDQGISNFKSITLPHCASCHGQNRVRADCSICHDYHRSPKLKELVEVK
jgi:hypothetical protein